MPKPRVGIADLDLPNAFATGRSPDRAVVRHDRDPQPAHGRGAGGCSPTSSPMLHTATSWS
ncbi:MAG: hypothetical protein R2731_16535 [Nocardioides sp.]